METLLVVICFMGAGLLIYMLPLPKKEKKISVLYGYPAGRTTWLTIYHRRSTDEWIFEWDDLFDSGRPKSWGDVSQDLMYKDKKSGATKEEFAKARKMLQKRYD